MDEVEPPHVSVVFNCGVDLRLIEWKKRWVGETPSVEQKIEFGRTVREKFRYGG